MIHVIHLKPVIILPFGFYEHFDCFTINSVEPIGNKNKLERKLTIKYTVNNNLL